MQLSDANLSGSNLSGPNYSSRSVQIDDLGLMEYSMALVKQEEAIEEIEASEVMAKLLVVTHPPVVTMGRKTTPDEVVDWSGSKIEVSRGGRSTYHGPSQVVIYPIVHLDRVFKPRDIHWYLRTLEKWLVGTLTEFGIQSLGANDSNFDGDLSRTGVWVQGRKIASIGIGVKKWIAYHGVAINLDFDPNAFSGIKPCGYSASVMTSVQEVLGKKVSREEFVLKLTQNFNFYFNMETKNSGMAELTQ